MLNTCIFTFVIREKRRSLINSYMANITNNGNEKRNEDTQHNQKTQEPK